jgi:hypothetical protein
MKYTCNKQTVYEIGSAPTSLELSERQMSLYRKKQIAEIYPEYYVIKVNQFNDYSKDTLDEWIYFLKNEKIKDGSKARGLKEAAEKLRVMKLSEEDRANYE